MTIVDELKRSHVDLLEAIDGLEVEELLKKNAIGDWSIRDVVLHMAMWEGEALKALAIWRMGHPAEWKYLGDGKTMLKFNQFWIDTMTYMSAEDVIRLFNLTHSALVADISAIPDDIWEQKGGFPPWIRDFTTDHNRHHIDKILAYRKTLGH